MKQPSMVNGVVASRTVLNPGEIGSIPPQSLMHFFSSFLFLMVIRYVCMTSTQKLVEIYNTKHPIAGQDIQHHSTILCYLPY